VVTEPGDDLPHIFRRLHEHGGAQDDGEHEKPSAKTDFRVGVREQLLGRLGDEHQVHGGGPEQGEINAGLGEHAGKPKIVFGDLCGRGGGTVTHYVPGVVSDGVSRDRRVLIDNRVLSTFVEPFLDDHPTSAQTPTVVGHDHPEGQQ